MGVHDHTFTYRTLVRCSCHPDFLGEGDNKAEALRNLEEKIEARSKRPAEGQTDEQAILPGLSAAAAQEQFPERATTVFQVPPNEVQIGRREV